MKRAAAACFLAVAGAWVALHQSACAKSEGCLGGEAGCTVPPPCTTLALACATSTSAFSAVRVLTAADRPVVTRHQIGTAGDIVLENDKVRAVIDALDHRHHLAPSGGTLLDLSTRGRDDDVLNQILQGTGLLPEDSALYTSIRVIEEGSVKAVQVTGHLAGNERHRISTRYEIRPCEPGIRIRTEIINLGSEPMPWSLSDGLFWGGENAIPFVPAGGRGFEHPTVRLSKINDLFVDVPFIAGSVQGDPSTAGYAVISCEAAMLSGFHSGVVSSAGTPRRIVMPGDYEIFERFVAAAPGDAVEPAIRVARGLRQALAGEPPPIEVRGRLVEARSGARGFGSAARASIHLSQGGVAVTETVPDPSGAFAVMVPAAGAYEIEVDAFGRKVAGTSFTVSGGPLEIPEIAVPPAGAVDVAVNLDGAPADAQVLIVPFDDATAEATRGRARGDSEVCTPMLGRPRGASPACNRALIRAGGRTEILLPEGKYWVYATRGLFATLDRRSVDVRAETKEQLTFELESLGALLPAGALSADFHVHGAASYDSSIPDMTRALSFSAAGMDVIAATDHDAIADYSAAIEALGLGDRLRLITGVETTALVLHRFVPEETDPKVIGHWNFWPMPRRPELNNYGLPWDELAEPGLLFERMRAAGFDPNAGVIQLNHPYLHADVGRDNAWPRSIEIDTTRSLLGSDDGSKQAMFTRTPKGSSTSNAAYHTQEVMNGTGNSELLADRLFWFYLLNQGLVRAGTANSDSHSLTDSLLGTPRSVVLGAGPLEPFDTARFNAEVKKGRVVGTNGPVIIAWTTDATGARREPGIEPFTPAADGVLEIEVSAAPWVPVDQIRIVVNGAVVKTFADWAAVMPADPLSKTVLVHLRSVPLREILPESGDAWIVVEAGSALPAAGDLDCNGIPDTTDNNGDGVIDWRDADQNEDDVVDERDQDLDEDGVIDDDPPDECDSSIGPMLGPPPPARESPRYPYSVVTPGGYPYAFTNPFVLDRDGGGFAGTGKVNPP